MRTKEKAPARVGSKAIPRDVAEGLAGRAIFDRRKVQRDSRRATQAADRLLKEMDDVLKNLPRKP